jgi:hypothetical protein
VTIPLPVLCRVALTQARMMNLLSTDMTALTPEHPTILRMVERVERMHSVRWVRMPTPVSDTPVPVLIVMTRLPDDAVDYTAETCISSEALDYLRTAAPEERARLFRRALNASLQEAQPLVARVYDQHATDRDAQAAFTACLVAAAIWWGDEDGAVRRDALCASAWATEPVWVD